MFTNIEGLTILDFDKVNEGDIFTTDLGKNFVEADDESKIIFRAQLEKISSFHLVVNTSQEIKLKI